jgi:lipid-A-disaccharide synthase
LCRELNSLLNDEATQQRLKTDYTSLRQLLGQGGHASARAAAIISEFLTPNP